MIEELFKNSSGYYARFFLVPKKDSNKWRAILDLSQLNQSVVKQKFKMETAENIRKHLKEGEWVMSVDLSDAYHHIPIHKNHTKCLRFCFYRRVFQYRV